MTNVLNAFVESNKRIENKCVLEELNKVVSLNDRDCVFLVRKIVDIFLSFYVRRGADGVCCPTT